LEPAPPFKVIANLPYYITSAILRHLLEAKHKPRVIVVMVQREVAQRLIARPPTMNLLAVSVQCFARAQIIRTVAAGAFYPRPQVDSAVVRLDILDTPMVDQSDAARFFDIVRAGFGEKRKQLRNSVAHGLGLTPFQVESILARLHIDPARRAETLALDEWAALCRAMPHSLR
jgi:16S rRNA (adenine1518-N6/adenine1519-N6)-dimethyltransferase